MQGVKNELQNVKKKKILKVSVYDSAMEKKWVLKGEFKENNSAVQKRQNK